MKTVLAAVAAGLIGAGASTGLMVSGVIPMESKPAQAQRAPTADDHHGEVAGLRADFSKLLNEQSKLRGELERANRPQPAQEDPRVATLEAEVAMLKKARVSVPVEAPTSGPTPNSGEWEVAVREVIAKDKQEALEARRQERQADRIRNLEAEKQRLSESVPRTVQAMATRLNIPETQVANVSTALIAHAHARAEIRSERQGQQIDGIEIDQASFDARQKTLDENTLSTLSSYVGSETAQSVLALINRARGGFGDETPRVPNADGGRNRGGDTGRNARRGRNGGN